MIDDPKRPAPQQSSDITDDGDISRADHDYEDYCYECRRRHIDEDCPLYPNDEDVAVPATPAERVKIDTGMGVTDKAARSRYMKWWRKISKTTKSLMKQGVSREVARIRAMELHGAAPARAEPSPEDDDGTVH